MNGELTINYRDRRITHPLGPSEFADVAQAWQGERWRGVTNSMGFVVTARSGHVMRGYQRP